MTSHSWSEAFFRYLIVSVAVVALLIIFLTGSEQKDLYDLFTHAVPAYFQAIGSVVAIWVGFSAARYQVKASDSARLRSIFAIAEAAYDYAKKFEAAVDASNNLALFNYYHPSIVISLLQTMDAVPVHEIGDSVSIKAFLRIRDQFFFMGQSIDNYIDGPDKLSQWKDTLEQIRNTGDTEYCNEMVVKISAALAENVRVNAKAVYENYALLKTSMQIVSVQS